LGFTVGLNVYRVDKSLAPGWNRSMIPWSSRQTTHYTILDNSHKTGSCKRHPRIFAVYSIAHDATATNVSRSSPCSI